MRELIVLNTFNMYDMQINEQLREKSKDDSDVYLQVVVKGYYCCRKP